VANAKTPPAAADGSLAETLSRDEMVALVKRARGGDETALPALRPLLKDPEAVRLLQGDLAVEAQRTLVYALSGKDLVLRECAWKKLRLLREELAGPDPTPVERLLVERVVACWLQVYYFEAMMANNLGASMDWSDFHQRRVDHAHKRYLSALRTLAQVRKLALPVLQVNIARKQVNIAAPAAVDAHEAGSEAK